MNGCVRFWTLVTCSGQLLVSKSYSNYNSRNKVIEKFRVYLIFVFLHGKILAPPCTSPNLPHNLSRDWLRVPLL